MCYVADRIKARQSDGKEVKHEIYEYTAMEIFKTLVAEKSGTAPKDEEHAERVQKMKGFLKETMKTDQIDKVDMDELKKQVEGEGMLARMKYRRQVQNAFSGKRPAIAKGEVMK